MTYGSERVARVVGLSIYDIIQYTTTGANLFTKADYPGLRAILVECQGAGGGSGGCALTAVSEAAAGGGGGGGGYARSLIRVDDLDVTEDVWVGLGGTAGAASGTGTGGVGGDSLFDTISGEVRGNGGSGGGAQVSTATTPRAGANGGAGGSGTGQLVVRGSSGSSTIINVTAVGRAKGGPSFMAGGPDENGTTSGAAGTAGQLYGGGASGSMNADNQGTAKAGAVGGQGIVIVTVYV